MIPTVRTTPRRTRARAAVAALLAMTSVLVVAGLVGATTPARAATGFDIDLEPLIGTTGNEVPQVTYGGKIGYHLHVFNSGDSTTQHASIVVKSKDDPLTPLVDETAAFADSDNGACVKDPTNTKQAVCTPPGGTLAPGDTFDANLRFTAPLTGPPEGLIVSSTAAVTVAAQSVGGKKNGNNGTTLQESDPPTLTQVIAGGTKSDTYLRETESAGTGPLGPGHAQRFGLTMPGTFAGIPPFGVALSIHDEVGAICDGCLGTHTALSIPAASLVTEPGNPFFTAGVPPAVDDIHPYGWEVSAEYSTGFQLTRLVHVDDAPGSLAETVPSCDSLGAPFHPTKDQPLCWKTLTQQKNKKSVSATGEGLENGKIGFG